MKMRGLSLAVSFIYGGPSNVAVNDLLRTYVVSRLHGDESVYAECGSLGVVSDEKILGAVLFHNWSDEYSIIELSAASDSAAWLPKKTLKEIFGICFDQLKVNQVFARHSVENKIIERIFKFIGGSQIILPNMRGKNRDESLMMLTEQQWRSCKLQEVKNGIS